MEIMIKCAALAVFSAISVLLIRRANPEYAFALSAATVAVLLLSGSALLGEAVRSFKDMAVLLGSSAVEIRPILKCLGIASISRLSADLCKDASQSAVAAAVETLGSICAAAVAAPMIFSLIKTIGGIL